MSSPNNGSPLREVLKKFGLDPEKIVDERKQMARDLNAKMFMDVSTKIKDNLDTCRHAGFGATSMLFVTEGAVEAALYAIGVACTNQKRVLEIGLNNPKVDFKAAVFGALLTIYNSKHMVDPVYFAGKKDTALEEAHAAFEKLFGHSFLDRMSTTCSCENCSARRAKHGVEIDTSGNPGL